ncbi:MAG: MBL fold metallo-hydrolase [Patescibacteria group bacterium]|nr:MBL fold metallo-hydrolase [Patescibacteria group bacterium]
MKLTFLGGAESVTGSNYLLEHENSRILIDCGMFQGDEDFEAKNVEPLPFDPHTIDAICITHSHIDHIGRIPIAIKAGYEGPIYSTLPTKEAATELLLDAYAIMVHREKTEAEKEGREPNEPLFTPADIDQAMSQWHTIHYHQPHTQGPFTVTYYDAGHILGSASIVVACAGVQVGFSGDLGNVPAPLVKDTEYLPAVDYALIESTYGGRVHPPIYERKEKLRNIIEQAVQRGGVVLIPAFSMERTQELLYELNDLIEHKHLLQVPIFVDSPLAIKITQLYEKHVHDPEYFDDEARAAAQKDDIFKFPNLTFTETTEESKKINSVPAPKVILAGSGMSNGGRVLHHELRYLQDPNNVIVFVGFQPKDSLGSQIINGAQEVTIMGDRVPVRAQVEVLGGYSAHADQPLLLKWIAAIKTNLKTLFVVQGDSQEQRALCDAAQKELGVHAVIPKAGESVELL